MSLLLAGAAISAVGQIYSGITSATAANRRASDLRLEGDIYAAESLRTANIIEEEGQKFAASQSLQYIGAGVQLGGSALITIHQTKKYAEAEANAVRAQGKAKQDLAYESADVTENEGRASLISGIIGGTTSFLNVLGEK